ncbi:MAG: [protein-PII] uridylyltransferase [Pirellulales bacterium]
MQHGDRLRSIVREVRQELVEGRQQLRAQHDLGMEGTRVCARYTTLVDQAIQKIFDAYLAELPESGANEIRQRVSLVAHGGYGRRQQAPFSDVDLMVLYDGKRDTPITQLASRLTQDICDVYQHLGNSLRTPADAVQLARDDAQVGTSLLESRLLLGNSDLFDRYSTQMKTMIERRQPTLAAAFIAERRIERTEYGESVYLLEPNVKRSRGGLRDIHLIRWLWYLRAGVADPDRLHDMGVLSKFDHRRLMSALNFLLRVRNEMHFYASETSDSLSRAEQLRLAEYFKYQGKQGMLPVEQFMRDYFHYTSHVWQMAHRLSELAQPVSRMNRVLEPITRRVQDDYLIGRSEVSATPRATTRLAQHPEEVLKLVDLARFEGKRISQDTWHFVYRTAPQYSHEPKPVIMDAFLKIIAHPLRLGELLRRLHDMGVLEKIIPEFSHARSFLQFNQYHKYTVDEHSIRAVEEATRFAERADVVGKVYRGLRDTTILHLALLIHDLGKGFEEDHSEVGARIARSTAERFQLPAEQAESLEFLVRKHLRMSHLAQKYDTKQPQLVARFVEEVATRANLDMLFLVTCADLAAVGPGVLNSWKVEVLSELYNRAVRKFAVDGNDGEPAMGSAERKAAWDLLTATERNDAWFERQLAALPEVFVSKRQPAAIVDALRRLRKLPPRAGMAWANYLKEIDAVEFIAGIDQGSGRAIFSSMAGALTGQRQQILAAETDVLADGLLLMRYVSQEPETPGEPSPERLAEVCRALVASIDSEETPRFPKILGREQKEAGALLTNLPNEVRIDNEVSEQCTVVEVFTIDRRGLLYRLARALHDVGLVIRFAKIGTYIDQVVDVFYVTDRDERKVENEALLAKIREALTVVITPS